MMSSKPLSTMDHMKKAEDMQYLIQPRGPGTGWVFRMVTPNNLIGKTNPWTGKPFGKEIRKGLKTRSLPDARRRRNIALGEITKLSFEESDDANFTFAQAEEWRAEIAEDSSEQGDVGSYLQDKLEAASAQGIPEEALKRFGRIAFGKGYPISKALEQYIYERSPDNRRGYKPLKKTTVLNLRTAVSHVHNFFGDVEEVACLEDMTAARAKNFRDEYLPSLTSKRSPDGMAYKTISKNITLLKQFWAWAIERNITRTRYRDPWVFPTAIRRASPSAVGKRLAYTPAELSKLLAATVPGSREGDILRLALVTGCRADELGSLPQSQVAKDGTALHIPSGKSANAKRTVPVPIGAQALIRQRLAVHSDEERLFPEWPIRKSVGKVYALSQWFTRFRRDVLGTTTDNNLSLHSLRHTWRTVAGQARVPDADIYQIGGWAKEQHSSSVYDHGLLPAQLVKSQEDVWEMMLELGYLEAF
ncbi:MULTISPECIES: tyrosine-type recombinase/integrase [Sulfitobacter]|uniref:Tyrosine-type recombinase/integrase n=1 Tax=Sulfitobacter profundi TaxID=2679961 RepID=A0ABW1Z069_9RHOB|nr:tyrosine-type recombinase/integrase [Sulfitobacter indolifex]